MLTTGVWSWSRHPNYLGDSLVWWGIALMSFGGSWWSFLSIFSAFIMTFLLMKVSGVPLLEHKMKHRAGWEEYTQKTPEFWPNWKRLINRPTSLKD